MKRITKLLVNLLSFAMLIVACCGLFGCSKDVSSVKLELNLAIYNTAEGGYYEDTTLTLTLYKEYAPETVSAIISYVNEGYYNDTFFYSAGGNRIMVGDLKMNDVGEVYQNQVKPTLKPEFERGAVTGSDLKVKEGSVGIWRTWFVQNSHADNTSLDTGRATMFFPTATVADYDGWFCLFATLDTTDSTNATTLTYLKSALENGDEYNVFYTLEDGAEYDATKDEENNGLTFNCMEEIPEDTVVFDPKGEQYSCYKQNTIKIAKGLGNTCGARIVSAKVID